MEVRDVHGYPGKLEVFLGGELITCNDGRDCPGAAICARSQEWQVNSSQGMCMCNTWFGFGGADCTELSSHSATILCLNIFTVALCIVNSVTGLVLLWRYAHYRLMLRRLNAEEQDRIYESQPHLRPRHDSLGGRLYVNPLVMTLAFATLGSVTLALGALMNMIVVIGFAHMFEYYPMEGDPNRLEKRPKQELDNAYTVLVALGTCFIVSSAVILPLTWLNITNRPMRIKKNSVNFVLAFAIVFTGLTLCVELPFNILMVSENRNANYAGWLRSSAVGWIVIYTGLICLNVLAFIQATVFVRASTSTTGSLYRILKRIQIAAALIIVLLIGALITSGVFSLVFRERSFYSNPRLFPDHERTSTRSGRAFIAALGLACVWFVFLPVRNIKIAAMDARHRQEANSRSSSTAQRENNLAAGTLEKSQQRLQSADITSVRKSNEQSVAIS